jgi:TPR repeat protein
MEQDKAAAEHWFMVGQKLHDPVSTFDLGTLFATVPDHTHDPAKAARYLRQAADMNYVPSMHSLGVLLLHHPELSKKPGEAVTRLQAAADAGCWQASVVLGVMAHTGNGIPANMRAAYFHLQVALLQGGAAARPLVERHLPGLEDSLGTEQARAVEADASAWVQQHSGGPALVRLKNNTRKFFADPASQSVPEVFNAALPDANPAS